MNFIFFRNTILVISLFTIRSDSKKCHVVTLEDSIAAVHAAKCIYEMTNSSIGSKVPNTEFVVEKFYTPTHRDQPLKAFVATYKKTTLISFQGTKTKGQLTQEFRSALKPKTPIKYGHIKVDILPFFWNAYGQFDIDKMIPNPSSEMKYIFTGHSLGGALASLMALHMKAEKTKVWDHPDSCLITFGEPRVGDADYALIHNRYIPASRKLRFVNRRDVVPHLPPRRNGFLHHAREIWIHDKTDHMFDFTKEIYWTACPLNDRNNICSNSLNIKNPSSHGSSKYVTALTTKPKGYLDRNNTERKTFEEALCA